MEYPREIYLDEDTEDRLISYLNDELLNHYAERSSFVEDLLTLQSDYYAQPTVKKKTFPFTGAANIVIPITAIAVEAVHAREMTTLFALPQFCSVKVPDAYGDIDHDLEKYIDHVMLKEVDFYSFCNNVLLENKKFGSCVGKSSYEKIIKTAVKTIGDTEHEFDVVVSQGPTADPVPLANFLMPYGAMDPQKSPWCGEEHLETSFQVKTLVESGFFRDDVWEKLENWVIQNQQTTLSSAPYTQKLEVIQNQVPVWPKQIGWSEIWLSFKVDGSNKMKEIVCHYHRLSQTIMSLRYNWYDDLHRPYRIGQYFPVENRWLGIGIAKQNEQFQREITTQHRQRLDNATLANMRMIKISKLAGYGSGEPVYPGKIWLVDNKDDIDTFQMGEIYPSAYNNETTTLSYSQQRSGVNELNSGMPQVGTPGTASSDLARLQEGNKKADFHFMNSKRFLNQIQKDVVCNVAQFGPKDATIFQYIPNGDQVQAFLQQPISLLRDEIIFSLNIVGQDQNKLLDRSAWTQMAGIIQQYWTGIFQLVGLTGNQQLAQSLIPSALAGSTEAFKQILQSFDINNINRIVPEQLIQLIRDAAPGIVAAGGNQKPQGNLLPSGVPSNQEASAQPTTGI